ncbi:MAG: hypothetical protein ABGZ53_26700, partial [Fuerstiella sp.]
RRCSRFLKEPLLTRWGFLSVLSAAHGDNKLTRPVPQTRELTLRTDNMFPLVTRTDSTATCSRE